MLLIWLQQKMNQKFWKICKCKCRFDGKNLIEINVGITNVYVSVKNVCGKDYIWNPL